MATEADRALHDVRMSMVQMATDITNFLQLAGHVKERIDDMLNDVNQKNYENRISRVYGAATGLTGSEDVQTYQQLQRFSETNAKRADDLKKLQTTLTTLQGQNADPAQVQSLTSELDSLQKQNELATNIQKNYVIQSLTKGNIDTFGNVEANASQMQQTAKSLALQLSELRELNYSSRQNLKPAHLKQIEELNEKSQEQSSNERGFKK